MEAVSFWNIKREGLLRSLWAAREDKTQYQDVLGAVRKFNQELPEVAKGKAITADSIRRSFESRQKATQARESGIPRAKADLPIVRDIQRLYPEAEVDVRKVR